MNEKQELTEKQAYVLSKEIYHLAKEIYSVIPNADTGSLQSKAWALYQYMYNHNKDWRNKEQLDDIGIDTMELTDFMFMMK